MKIGKKILIYLFCGLLTFSVVSSSYYKTVHAFEYVGGALAFEEALKWLLAAIGITATAGMTDAYWDAYGDDFVDYAIQNGSTQQEVAEWQLKACEGVLDKASNVWTQFKSWAKSLINSSEGGEGGSGTIVNSGLSYPAMSYDIISFLNNTYNANVSIASNFTVYNFVYEISNGNLNFIFLNTTPNNVSTISNDHYYSSVTGLGSMYLTPKWSTNVNNNWSFASSTATVQRYVSDNIIVENGNYNTVTYTNSGSVSDSLFNGISGVNTDDLDVISSSGVNEADDEVAIPYPGVSDSDNTLSNDTYQDIVDKINDGTITQEQGIEQIQEILRVITYDTVTDEVVPPQKNDDGTNKTKDDALKDNKENAGFTLAGLENVFPFCIPFDIYAFMTLLVADPVTPEFDFPIKTVNGQEETIHVDLEPFEPVAVVVRYVFDFLFIVGLAMLTRSLIGGGSSD